MKHLRLTTYFLATALLTMVLTSCSDDDNGGIATPITLGSGVNVNNTFESVAFGFEETDFAVISGMNAGDFAADATVSNAMEFPAYIGLYDIDITENSIYFELIAEADDPTFSDLYRIIEAGTFDRYYLTFDQPQNVTGFISSNDNVNLRIDSDTVLVVEIGEGYDFNPDQAFTITLNRL